MKTKTLGLLALGATALLSISISSCKKESVAEVGQDEASLNAQSELLLKSGNMNLPGRTLAANCFQCHGTNGYAGELKIAGESASEIIGEINEMKSKNPGRNIMNVHAQGYTAAEMNLIADYFSKQ
jgi:cytochrome subunit of sulfide dehydrogenase